MKDKNAIISLECALKQFDSLLDIRGKYKRNDLQMVGDNYFDELLELDFANLVSRAKHDAFGGERNVSRFFDTLFASYVEINPNMFFYTETKKVYLDSVIDDIKEFQIFITGKTLYIIGLYKNYPHKVHSQHKEGETTYYFYYPYLFFGVIFVDPYISLECNSKRYDPNGIFDDRFSSDMKEIVSDVEYKTFMSGQKKIVLSKEKMIALLNSNGIIYGVPTKRIHFYKLMGCDSFLYDELISNGWWKREFYDY